MVTFSLQNKAERAKEDFFLGVNRDLTLNRMLPKYYHWMITGETRKTERKKLCFNHILQLHSAIRYASGRICASRKRAIKQLWILNSLEKSLIILITIYISIGYDNWIVQRWTKKIGFLSRKAHHRSDQGWLWSTEKNWHLHHKQWLWFQSCKSMWWVLYKDSSLFWVGELKLGRKQAHF